MPSSSRRARLRTLLLLAPLLGATALAGCADREQAPAPDTAAAGAGFPVTIQAEGGPPLTLETRPERIVSLSPSATETLFAVGAGKQVVAADNQSSYPEQAPDKPELSGLTPSPEAIASYDPDLVVVSADVNDLSSALAKTGTQTLVLPDARTLKAAYAQFELVGKATGHADEGADLAQRTRQDLDKIVADTPEPGGAPLTYYHELDPTYYSATSATFIGQVYGKFGLVNIADGDDPQASGGYPQLSAERILQADPDLIFLADSKCCGQNAETVAARPGWDTLTAVREGHVVALDDDIASRWSPRVVELARAVSEAVADAATAPAGR
jgi:iron complex transport system substrate-binding protein